jgi:hypothetical protein
VSTGNSTVDKDAPTYYVIAMAHHQLGNKEEAVQAIEQARKRIDLPVTATVGGRTWADVLKSLEAFRQPTGGDELGRNWEDFVMIYILRREAEALVNETDNRPAK